MLFRNINHSKSLFNGTRLVCYNFSHYIIDAQISVGYHKGKMVFIHMISFLPYTSENNGFPFKRIQFSIRLSFAIIINKSHKQILDSVGMYLSELVLSHKQLYISLSRAKSANSAKFLIRPTTTGNCKQNYIKNIV